jgi:hypothetical protein
MRTTVGKFGLYGLILAFILFLTGLYFGMEEDFSTQEIIGYLTILLSLSFIFPGIKHYRDKINGGKLRLRKAVLIGLQISAFTAIGIAIADLIYTTTINPDFFEEYEAVKRAEGYKGEIPDYGSIFMAFVMFLTVMVVGLAVALISAFILRRH